MENEKYGNWNITLMKTIFKTKSHTLCLYLFFIVLWTPYSFSKETKKIRMEWQPFIADKVMVGENIQKTFKVFNKYIDVASPLADNELLSIRYYKFSIKKDEKNTIIKVSHDNKLIMQELEKRIKGGGGTLIIDNISNEITSYTLDK